MHNIAVFFRKAACPNEVVRVGFCDFRLCATFVDLVRSYGNDGFRNTVDLFGCGASFCFVFPFCDRINGRKSSSEDFFSGIVIIIIDGNADTFYIWNDGFCHFNNVSCPFDSFVCWVDWVYPKNDMVSGESAVNQFSNGFNGIFVLRDEGFHFRIAPAGNSSMNNDGF